MAPANWWRRLDRGKWRTHSDQKQQQRRRRRAGTVFFHRSALHCTAPSVQLETKRATARSELNIAICCFAVFLFQALISSEHLTKVLTHSISADISFRRHNCVFKPDQRYHSRYGAAGSIPFVKKRHKSVLTYTWQYTL